MAAVFRAFGFLVSAIGVELSRGVGLAILAAALLIGWRRWPVLTLAIVAAVGATISILLPESSDAPGKVMHGLSNAPFVAFVYIVIAAGGYAIGRVMRRLQS